MKKVQEHTWLLRPSWLNELGSRIT